MKRISEVLALEISEGSVDWEGVLKQKVDAALRCVDNTFEGVREEDGTKHTFYLKDELTFRVKKFGTIFCYKLIQPRFIGANYGGVASDYYCSGIQIGTYGENMMPIFPEPPRMF